jgi:hypothetical protein
MMVGDQVTNFFELVSPARASFTDWKFLTNRGKTEVFIFKHAYDDYKSLKLKGQVTRHARVCRVCACVVSCRAVLMRSIIVQRS